MFLQQDPFNIQCCLVKNVFSCYWQPDLLAAITLHLRMPWAPDIQPSPANSIPGTHLLMQFAYDQFSPKAFFSGPHDWRLAHTRVLSQSKLAVRRDPLELYVTCVSRVSDERHEGAPTGRGAHLSRGRCPPLLCWPRVCGEGWWCGWREAISFITMSKSCNSMSPCRCQRLPPPFLFSIFPFWNGYKMLCKFNEPVKNLTGGDIIGYFSARWRNWDK